MRNGVATVLGIVFAIAALFHVAAITEPITSASFRRHLAFVGINAFFSYACLRRVRWLLIPFVPFCVQQSYSHGHDFLEAWRRGQVDFASVGVFALLPIMLLLAISLWRNRSHPDAKTDIR